MYVVSANVEYVRVNVETVRQTRLHARRIVTVVGIGVTAASSRKKPYLHQTCPNVSLLIELYKAS